MKLLRKITDKRILYIFTLFILIFIPILKQASFYLVKYGIINNHDSINIAIVLYISMPFLIYVYIKNLIKTKRETDKYDYLLYILITAGIVATMLSMDKQMSLFGKDYRHEGFLTVLSYYLLFITWKVEGNKEDIKRIIKVIIFMALFNSIYAIFQIYTSSGLVLRYSLDKEMATGLVGNPNFFGSLIVTAISIVTTRFFIDKKLSIKQLLVILFLYISLINAQSTGPFMTYAITIIFLLIYLFIKKKLVMKNTICLILCLIITFPLLFYINKEVFKIDKCEMCDFVLTVCGKKKDNNSSSKNKYTISNGRMEIWENSLNIAKDNLITGVGYDNFYLAYYKDVNLTEVYFVSVEGQIKSFRKYGEIVDNAHNVYLHTLVSSGLFGLIPYLVLCLLTFIKGLKTKENLVILLLGGFVAYSIQAFANINVIQVTPIYYVIIGLILSIKE